MTHDAEVQAVRQSVLGCQCPREAPDVAELRRVATELATAARKFEQYEASARSMNAPLPFGLRIDALNARSALRQWKELVG
jgi:hypothetical protein